MDNKLQSLIDEIKEKTKKECYKFVASDEKAKITDSKIGGNPYLPVGENYPIGKKGEPLPLLIQINFEGIELKNFPNKGILQLFADKDVDWPTEYQIKYYEDISKESQTEFPDIDLKYFFIENEVKINLEKSIAYMSVNDFRFDDIVCELASKYYGVDINSWMDLEDVTDVNLDDIFNAFVPDKGNIGGYADFTQTDPRENELGEDYTECLIKIDSVFDSEIEIGDSGIAWVLMTKEDLANKNFDNAAFDWDCC